LSNVTVYATVYLRGGEPKSEGISFQEFAAVQKGILEPFDIANFNYIQSPDFYAKNASVIEFMDYSDQPKSWHSLRPKRASANGTQIQFSDAIKTFIKNSGLPEDTTDTIDVAARKIKEFINSKGLTVEIKSDLFVDREEPDWKEIKLRIGINTDLDFIFDNLKSPVYNILIQNLPKAILKKILIKFEPL